MNGPAKKEWDTLELQKDFIVKSFCYGVVVVTRKKDEMPGTLNFDHLPRKYYNFIPSI